MNRDFLENELRKIKLDQNFYYFSEIDSTNNFTVNLANKNAPEWTIVLAEHQTHGRGRMERKWESIPGESLLFSFILRPDLPVFQVQLVSLMLGISTVEFFERYTRKELGKNGMEMKPKFKVKWPNDIYLNGKKMGGILLQTSIISNYFSWVVCGIGLNINQTPDSFSSDIKDRATSLFAETGIEWDNEHIFPQLMGHLKKHYHYFQKDFSRVIPRWKRKALYLGKQIKVHQYDRLVRGKFIDLNENGHLIMENYDGQIEIISGDVLGRKEKL